MSHQFMDTVIRKNWPLLLALAAICAVVIVRMPAAPAEAQGTTRTPKALPAPVDDPVAAQATVEREIVLAEVRKNEEGLAQSTDRKTTAAYLAGLVNLHYQRLRDYETAARYYEQIISDYSDAPGLYQTYVQLALCYERLNQPEKRLATLRTMMAAFPEDSQQYAYAYSELYGEMPPVAALNDAAVEVVPAAQ